MVKALASLAFLLCFVLPAAAFAAEAARPAWSELTATQRKLLAPLEAQWPQISTQQKKRWIALANRFPKLSPAEQKRVQERMQDWSQLTPQQRDAARARYRALSKLTPEQRRVIIRQWTESQEAQQALPTETPPEAPESPRAVETPAAGESASIPPADKPAAAPQ
jgi:hypothetical protein